LEKLAISRGAGVFRPRILALLEGWRARGKPQFCTAAPVGIRKETWILLPGDFTAICRASEPLCGPLSLHSNSNPLDKSSFALILTLPGVHPLPISLTNDPVGLLAFGRGFIADLWVVGSRRGLRLSEPSDPRLFGKRSVSKCWKLLKWISRKGLGVRGRLGEVPCETCVVILLCNQKDAGGGNYACECVQ